VSVSENQPYECPTCKRRREHLQAIGMGVFCCTVVSCGILLPLTFPLMVTLMVLANRPCESCSRDW
jgi:hypothetical protein